MEHKLTTYLRTHGITQADFAARIGITQGALSKLCARGAASAETALAVEQATGGEVRVTDFRPFNIVTGAS